MVKRKTGLKRGLDALLANKRVPASAPSDEKSSGQEQGAPGKSELQILPVEFLQP